MITAKHFTEAEFARCSPSCSLQDMQQVAMNGLDAIRDRSGVAMLMTSAYRSPEWDKSKGRSGTGAHTLGMAADIRCNDSSTRFKLIQAAIQTGCNRIGIAKTYIHFDFSKQNAQNVIWTYY